ncbi:hypothetical protein CCY01nite_37860 [Chitinophaga cymbidii]|uniref:Right handed beta helix domain-containing protein n=3 Tax=Chitinophaga cymbidii TaxID=1096750 RepID=A0A512RPA3_9BACT|nr:hypothetical protein CCY01nite_37860 [Chitinophaga cymbidii]
MLMLPAFSSFGQTIFNYTESAKPGEVVGIQGDAFGNVPKVFFAVINGSSVELPLLEKDTNYVAVRIPVDAPEGMYVLKVGNSQPVYINRARVMSYEYDEVMPGTVFRLFGRNMWMNKNAKVQFVHPANGRTANADIIKGDAFSLQLKTPGTLEAGVRYKIKVNNGTGGHHGDSYFDETLLVRKAAADPFGLNVPWGADFSFSRNVYNIKTDTRLIQRNKNDDRLVIQEAIDKAHADGGGVVYLPAGHYKLIYETGSGLIMRSRVVLKGDGKDKTIITYGYGKPFSTERVKAPYGWTLGWPDSRSEGMAMVWPGGITTSGLLDLSMKNVNESGAFVHTIKNMPEGGSRLFVVNCGLDFNTGWGLALVNVDKLLLANNTMKSTSVDVRGINAPTRTWPQDIKNSYNVICRNNTYEYNAGRFGANGCHHAIFENNRFIRNGDHQAKGETGGLSLDYVTDVIVQANTFEVTGTPVLNRNQGETILSQGGNPHQQSMGKVTKAGALTLEDWKTEWQDFTDRVMTEWQYAIHPTNYTVAIVHGKGAGQWRTIVKNNDTVLTIDRPWDVVPAPGSHYVITQWSCYQMLVRDNILKGNNRGIWMYCGNADLVITGNKLVNSEGIYIRADQRLAYKRYNLSWNTLITNNTVENTDGRRAAFIAAYLAQEKNANIFGTGMLNMTVRGNTVRAYTPNVVKGSFVKGEGYFNANGSGEIVAKGAPGILGSIFENNRSINTGDSLKLAGSVFHTVVSNE